ncbi:hypothetical protein [Arsukibacterium indicum]|uniref:Uncharacterized protein n=1 Tax=Arsukibacterium indicum TaxID=2848612 RepID=A0ABS6MGK3_9GAMM|nr:hypothetical protein [Arsukibacterium indicum]MBV2127955.1 hypothetical protein [Arsukibacterium indicum]
MSKLTFEQFTKDVKNHQLTTIKDDGLYRHLLVKQPGTIEMHYEIITWPGYLCYCGDMGTFVFERVEDMFCFFRKTPGTINEPYWSEKLQATDRSDGHTKFCRDEFERAVTEVLNDWLEAVADDGLDPDFIQEEKDKVDEIIAESHQNEFHAVAALNNHQKDDGGLNFWDFWENDCKVFTERYTWCCYALVHAIALYDAAKAAEVAA